MKTLTINDLAKTCELDRDAMARVRGGYNTMQQTRPLYPMPYYSPSYSSTIDVNQNLPGRTTVTPYSLRAKDEPTASTPLLWEEVEDATGGAPLRFTSADVLARVAEHGDLFEPLLTGRRGRLPAA